MREAHHHHLVPRFRIPHKPSWLSQGKLYLWPICWVQSIKLIVIVKHPQLSGGIFTPADRIICSFRNIVLKPPIEWAVDNSRVYCNTRRSETFRFMLPFFPFAWKVEFQILLLTWWVETVPLNEELTAYQTLLASELQLNVGHPYEIDHKHVLIAGGEDVFNN